MRGFGFVCLILVMLTFVTGFDNLVFAQEVNVDINALFDETLKEHPSGDRMGMVWWFPEDSWRVLFSQDTERTPVQIEQLISVLRPYIMVIAVDGDIGTFGGISYYSEDSLRENIYIIDSDGTRYSPLKDESIDSDIKNFLRIVKPMLINGLEQLGENINFFLFPSKTNTGIDIANAKSEGTFSVKLNEQSFQWRLPLSSLVPPKICPVDKEKLNGAWKFCPWHGAKL